MAGPLFFDRVKESTATVGTITFVLGGAATGFRAFGDVLSNADTCFYCCAGQGTAEWEVGIGTYDTGTLARTTVLASSNANALVDFSAGSKDIFLDLPAYFIGGVVWYGETEPADYLKYPLWWNSTDGNLKVRYDDGDSVQYVDAMAGIVGPQGSTGATGAQGIQGIQGIQGPAWFNPFVETP